VALGLGGVASILGAVVIGTILVVRHRREPEPAAPDELVSTSPMVAVEATEAS